MKRIWGKAFLLAAAGLAVAACEENFVEQKITQTFPTGPAPRVLVGTHNGSIHVRVGTRFQGVTATVVKRGYGANDRAAQQSLGNLVLNANQAGDEVNLSAEQGDARMHNAAHYYVEVPPGATLDLTSVNGCIDVAGVEGEVLARTTNACITAEHVTGHVDLHSTNGDITLKPDGAVVSANTTNANISLDGALGVGANILTTTNGGVDVLLPRAATFTLDANTTHGHIGTDFPVTSGLHNGENTLQATVGANPLTQLVINTTNGDVTVNQAP